MKKIIFCLLIMICFLPNVCNASSIVMDMDSNRVLYGNDIHDKKLIASTTKIMTALLAVSSNRLEEIVKVGDEVLTMYGSNIYIEKQEEILLLDLVYGLMLRSGNDASVSIAKAVGGSIDNFVMMMNQKAKELGMNDTVYQNPNGLDDETKNYSSVYDLCLLYSYAYKYPVFKNIVGTKYYNATSSLKSYSWKNRNNLLFTYDKSTGGKTGYTPLAGRILVSSAESDNMNLCIATIDKNSYLYDFHEQKYEYYFSNYQNYTILDKDNFYLNNYPNAYLKESFSYTLNEDEIANLKIDFHIDKNNKDKEVFGKAVISLNKDIIGSVPIYQKIDKEEVNLFHKIYNFFTNLLR